MQVDHGRVQIGMSEEALDEADVDVLLQEVRSVGMAQCVDRDAFFVDSRLAHRFFQCSLDAADGHRVWGFRDAPTIAPQSRKEQAGMFVGEPVFAQHGQDFFRQRNVAVLGPFAAVNMDHHP